nr:Si:ch211-147a11.3 protein [Danio rerio]
MRAKQTVVVSLGQRVCGAVSLNPPGVKSSVKKAARRRVLLQRSAPDIARAVRQMAGDGGEAKRLPKRPFHGEVEENSSAAVDGNVKIQPGKKAPGERRGKENSAAKCTGLTSGSAEAKMEQSVHGLQTTDPSVFFDEDSNHVFPVEQFFGNLDVVEDYPRRTPGSKRMTRREYRSMHYYAKEDSEDEHL